VVVAFMLAFATSVTSTLVVLWYRRTFFTAALQLEPRALDAGRCAGPTAK
jgi:hypothetical protein